MGARDDEVTFWFDPGCPWTWATSRWLVEAAAVRGLRSEWRLMSLWILNEGRLPEQWRERTEFGSRVLRVLAATRAAGGDDAAGNDAGGDDAAGNDAAGNDAVSRLYGAYAHRVHDLDEPFEVPTLAAALGDAGLPIGLLAAFGDPSWDAGVRRDHEASQEAAAGEAGSPVMAYRGVGWFGPVLSPAPTGEEAGRVWDDLTRFITHDGIFEVKRGRTRPPRVA